MFHHDDPGTMLVEEGDISDDVLVSELTPKEDLVRNVSAIFGTVGVALDSVIGEELGSVGVTSLFTVDLIDGSKSTGAELSGDSEGIVEGSHVIREIKNDMRCPI